MTPATETPVALRVLLVLSTLLGFASISTDLCLPGLPAMAAALRADAGMVELTIAGYLAAFGAGHRSTARCSRWASSVSWRPTSSTLAW